MALLKIKNTALLGVACCVPKNCEKTDEYPFPTEQERDGFIKGTGIEERRVGTEELCASDMCFEAADQLIKDLAIDREQIKMVVFVSQSPDYFLPATAIILQNRLGLSKNCLAFDVGLGCSGYVYGLSIAGSLLQSMDTGYALLLAGDKSTFSANLKDKSTRPLFGDAGSATILGKSNTANPLFFNLQSDGSGFESIIIKGGGTRLPYDQCSTEDKEIEKGIWRNDLSLVMDGVEVFNFSLREVKKNVMTLLEEINIDKEEIDYFVMHQANRFLNETVRKKIKIDANKVPYSIKQFGNTSSASIPLTMVTELSDELSTRSLKMLFSGFGVGLSWGSMYLQTSKLKISKLIEL